MAFTLQIRAKGLFQRKKIDFEKLINTILETSELGYGSNGDFFILQEGKIEEQSVILYNPNCIGRGIYVDGQAAHNGILEISYNIPSTAAEIDDFLMLVSDICKICKKVNLLPILLLVRSLSYLKKRYINCKIEMPIMPNLVSCKAKRMERLQHFMY